MSFHRWLPRDFFKSLFFRILCSFLLIMALTGLLGIALSTAYHRLFFKELQIDITHLRDRQVHEFILLSCQTGLKIHQLGGFQEYMSFRSKIASELHAQFFLLKDDGSTLSREEISPFMAKLVQQIKAEEGGENIIVRHQEGAFYIAGSLPGADSARFTFVGRQLLPPPPGQGFFIHPPPAMRPSPFFPGLGISFFPFRTWRDWILGSILFCTVTVFCYFLASSLLKPLRGIQRMSRQMASGDYSARIGQQFITSGGEVAELGRDFNLMAERTQQLIDSQKQLLRDISHELRSPLTRLKVALELARPGCDDSATSALERIELESDRLNEFIDELLALTRLNNLDVKTDSEAFDLVEVIHQIALDIAYEMARPQPAIQIRGNTTASLRGNKRLISRAIANIVRNGMRYSGPDGIVVIEIISAEQEIHIVIHDNGPGLPEEELAKIFQPFYRVSRARERESGGLGLGLAIAEKAILQHGGTISASNRNDGRSGLKINLCLPTDIEMLQQQDISLRTPDAVG